MKEKIYQALDLTIKQEKWEESCCFHCIDAICCCLLPLVSLEIKNRADFISLAILSCYPELQLGLKKSFEWTIYYKTNCTFFNESSRKCNIHSLDKQSIVCKSYDACNCWYQKAFHTEPGNELILFDLERLLWLEKKPGEYSWEELSSAISHIPRKKIEAFPVKKDYPDSPTLDFAAAGKSAYLFFPPFKKPERMAHFELIRFRLGFPGISLCLADNYWAYLLKTELDQFLFQKFRDEYYPALTPAEHCFHFNRLNQEKHFYSGLGNKWVIAKLQHLDALMAYTTADACGNITSFPAAKDILQMIRTLNPLPGNPDKAA